MFFLVHGQILYAQIPDGSFYVYPLEDEPIPVNPDAGTAPPVVDCNSIDPSNPCPYSQAPTLLFRVNFHFVSPVGGGQNFTKWDDGTGGPLTAEARVAQIIEEANRQTEQNSPVWGGAPGTAQCPLNFKVVCNGVYFHEVNAGYNPVSKKYAPQALFNYFNSNGLFSNQNSEINVLIFESSFASGIAYGNHITLHNVWSDYIKHEKNQGGDWYKSLAARVLWHEILHNNGLPDHPFQIDQCDDTPTLNPTCWNWNPNPNAGCYNSNNLMDYNSHMDWSLSPCQICAINQNYNPNYVTTVPPGCTPAIPEFSLRYVHSNQFYMLGSPSTGETKHFIEIYRTSGPNTDDIIGNSYFAKWFPGEIGDVNLSTYCPYNFCENPGWLRIKLAVMSDCAPWAEKVGYTYWGCAFNADAPKAFTVQVSPNPADQVVNVGINISEGKALTIRVVDGLTGGVAKMVSSYEPFPSGESLIPVSVSNLGEGTYYLQVIGNEAIISKPFIIQRNH